MPAISFPAVPSRRKAGHPVPRCSAVGVEQVEGDAPDLSFPDSGGDAAVRILDLDDGRRAVRAAGRLDRKVVKIVVLVRLLLPSGFVEVLASNLLIQSPTATNGTPRSLADFR
jgi:hypothetical protein